MLADGLYGRVSRACRERLCSPSFTSITGWPCGSSWPTSACHPYSRCILTRTDRRGCKPSLLGRCYLSFSRNRLKTCSLCVHRWFLGRWCLNGRAARLWKPLNSTRLFWRPGQSDRLLTPGVPPGEWEKIVSLAFFGCGPRLDDLAHYIDCPVLWSWVHDVTQLPVPARRKQRSYSSLATCLSLAFWLSLH